MTQLKDMIFLDVGCAVHFFMNEYVLVDIKECNKKLYLETYGGTNISSLLDFFDDIEA